MQMKNVLVKTQHLILKKLNRTFILEFLTAQHTSLAISDLSSKF